MSGGVTACGPLPLLLVVVPNEPATPESRPSTAAPVGGRVTRQFEARIALLERGSLCDVQEALTTLDKVLPEFRTDVKP